jgi:zinc protease
MRRLLCLLLSLLLPAVASAAAPKLAVPLDYYRLDNGLRVVLAPEHSAPTVTIGVFYRIGFRIEPRGRTGFAHLFEHMMFQGSANLAKMEFMRLVQGNGGVLNGSTNYDYTNYYEVVPANTLETILWAEADRMRGLAVTQENLDNQRSVVENEIAGKVTNQPYGGFPLVPLAATANRNWHNAHNFWGEPADLRAASLADVQAFFDQYYPPNNAVLVVAGDFDDTAARAWIRRYFGPIAARATPARPDVSEPRQRRERRHRYTDRLAPRPALALGWHAPPRGTPEHAAMTLLDQLLVQGTDSLLWQRLVNERGYTSGVGGGLNLLGSPFEYEGPMQWMVYLIHDTATPPRTIAREIDAVIERLRREPVTAADLERARTKLRAGLYATIGSSTRFGLVDLLASFALFDDDPARINRLEDEFAAVTPELVQRVARDYLRGTNRTVVELLPGRNAARPGDAP